MKKSPLSRQLGLTLAASIALATSAVAVAGDRVDICSRASLFGNGRIVQTIDLEAGGVLLTETHVLQSVMPFSLPATNDLARVSGDLWLATNEGILRFSTAPLTYLGQSLAGEWIVSLTPTTFGATLVTNMGQAIEVDAAGAEIRRFTQLGVVFRDIDAFQGGYLAVVQDRVERYDANFVAQGEFAGDAFAIAQQQGFNYDPDDLNVLSDGRVAIGGITSVAIVESTGTVVDVFNPEAFEQAAFLTGGGALLIPYSGGIALFDDVVGATVLSPGPDFSTSGLRIGSIYSVASSPTVGRSCTATPNSTGRAARIHAMASPSLFESMLSTVGTGMPSGTFGIPIYGMVPANLVLGDGRLCISPVSGSFTRGPVGVVGPTGSLATEFDYVTPGLGLGFAAGSTWYHQVVFRDIGPSGINSTDAIFMTFEL